MRVYSLSTYLDELRSIRGVESDTELAKVLKVTRSYISQVRGGMYMGDAKCFELSKMTGHEPLELLSLNRAIRTKETKVRNYWLLVHAAIKSGNRFP